MTQSTALPRSTPESLGIASGAVRSFLEEVKNRGIELHSFLLVRHGQVAAEAWWPPYAAERPHLLYSLSKSFTSTAVGLAVAEGRFGLDDQVLSFFPDQAPAEASDRLAALKVRHLLCMASGHAEHATKHVQGKEDWVSEVLSFPLEYDPGTHFAYNNGCTYLLSAIVQKTTGRTLLEYLTPRLFEPLGIAPPTWVSCPRGINVGAFGLSVRTEDIAKLGQLYLQRGEWQGRRLLPESWIAQATAKQIDNDDGNSWPDWIQGYGYQFWRCRHGAYRGDGAFGQYCVVMPEQEAVIAITSGVDNMQEPLDLIWEHLLPAMKPGTLPADPAAVSTLETTLASLGYPAPAYRPAGGNLPSDRVLRYAIEENEIGIRSLELRWGEHSDRLTLDMADPGHGASRTATAEIGRGEWADAVLPLYTWSPQAKVSGTWTADGEYEIVARFIETPHTLYGRMAFEGDKLRLSSRLSVILGEKEGPTLVGKLQP